MEWQAKSGMSFQCRYMSQNSMDYPAEGAYKLTGTATKSEANPWLVLGAWFLTACLMTV